MAAWLSVYPSVCLSVWLSVYPSVCLTICLSFCLSAWLSVYYYLCLPDYLFILLSVCLTICLSLWLPVCLTVCPSIYLTVYLLKAQITSVADRETFSVFHRLLCSRLINPSSHVPFFLLPSVGDRFPLVHLNLSSSSNGSRCRRSTTSNINHTSKNSTHLLTPSRLPTPVDGGCPPLWVPLRGQSSTGIPLRVDLSLDPREGRSSIGVTLSCERSLGVPLRAILHWRGSPWGRSCIESFWVAILHAIPLRATLHWGFLVGRSSIGATLNGYPPLGVLWGAIHNWVPMKGDPSLRGSLERRSSIVIPWNWSSIGVSLRRHGPNSDFNMTNVRVRVEIKEVYQHPKLEFRSS